MSDERGQAPSGAHDEDDGYEGGDQGGRRPGQVRDAGVRQGIDASGQGRAEGRGVRSATCWKDRICALEQQTACSLDPVVGELAEYVRTQPASENMGTAILKAQTPYVYFREILRWRF